MKITDEQREVLQKLRSYYCQNFAEDQQDGSNFDCAVLDLLDDRAVEKQMDKSFYRFSGTSEEIKKHEHTFEPDMVPGWKVCSSCKLTKRI